jgi:molecular chaperone GrpE
MDKNIKDEEKNPPIGGEEIETPIAEGEKHACCGGHGKCHEEAETDDAKLAADYLDGWKRCMADLENYKKRQIEAQKSLVNYSVENFTLQILPVIDNFHTSTEHIPEDQKSNPWVVGIMHIQKQLEGVLSVNGVVEIPVKIGDEFNPQIHDAVHLEENKEKEEGEKHKVSKIVLRGYQIGEKVIRPARVVVE